MCHKEFPYYACATNEGYGETACADPDSFIRRGPTLTMFF